MTDARSKKVYDALIDKVSTIAQLRSLATDMGVAMQKGEVIDIPTRSAIQIEDASNGASMTVQTIEPSANTLTVDSHKGAIVGIPKLNRMLNMEGSYYDQLAQQILTEIGSYMDQAWYDTVLRDGAGTAALVVNPAGDALSIDDTENALAIMTDQKGVRLDRCVWCFSAYGIGSLRRNSAWQPNTQGPEKGVLGMPVIGMLHGAPVVQSQDVLKTLSIATSAVTIATNVATATVAEGHGFVPGMVISTTGLTTNATDATITSVTATTIVFPLTASNGALADGVGTITCTRSFNSLIHMPWTFKRELQVPDVNIVPVSNAIQDNLQADAIWGFTALPGSAVALLSPASSVA